MSNIKQVAVLGADGNYGTPSDIGVDLANVDITKATATAVNSATGTTPANAEEAIEAMAETLENKAEASHNQDASSITSGTLSSDRLPTVPVSKGGTGATTLASGQALIGNGTGAVTGRAITATPAADSTSLFTAGGAYTELAKKAPTGHASTTTTYGASSGSNYGHTKLSDNYTSSAGAAASGIGASSEAVYNCYNELNSKLGGLSFGIDGDGNYGYYGADGSLIPFSSFGGFEAVVSFMDGKISSTSNAGFTTTVREEWAEKYSGYLQIVHVACKTSNNGGIFPTENSGVPILETYGVPYTGVTHYLSIYHIDKPPVGTTISVSYKGSASFTIIGIKGLSKVSDAPGSGEIPSAEGVAF